MGGVRHADVQPLALPLVQGDAPRVCGFGPNVRAPPWMQLRTYPPPWTLSWHRAPRGIAFQLRIPMPLVPGTLSTPWGSPQTPVPHVPSIPQEYQARRKEIVAHAFTYRHGQPITRIDYTRNEVTVWRTVWKELMKLFPTHTCRQYPPRQSPARAGGAGGIGDTARTARNSERRRPRGARRPLRPLHRSDTWTTAHRFS